MVKSSGHPQGPLFPASGGFQGEGGPFSSLLPSVSADVCGQVALAQVLLSSAVEAEVPGGQQGWGLCLGGLASHSRGEGPKTVPAPSSRGCDCWQPWEVSRLPPAPWACRTRLGGVEQLTHLQESPSPRKQVWSLTCCPVHPGSCT